VSLAGKIVIEMVQRAGIAIFIACVILTGCFSPSKEGGFQELIGRATLENSTDHSDIEIFFSDFGFSLLTDSDGTFYLPSEMYEGTWQIIAKFPYYKDAYGKFEVFEGGLKKPVELKLEQLTAFEINVDRLDYYPAEKIHIVVTLTNLTTESISFESESFPLFAVCLAKNFEPRYGGIYIGDKPVPSKFEMAPYETKTVEIFWDIPLDVKPGEYQLFSAPVDSKNHPAYFDPDMTRLHKSLLRKLPYAAIQILPPE